MAHIKKVVIHGFKSFAKKTEIPFDKGINVVIGPNGSGKSNISDAICFALGRLSIKSMRAEKARNLIFMGSKYDKPAKEASVELIFDNSDRIFSIESDEIILKRIVRVNGQSIYKLNNETKARAEIVEALAQAGIDPYGFNILPQGKIQSIVRIHPEERRKIIGEVAGISVYEWRKEKSLKELEKTDSRLKEISAILRERTAYMNNLEKEKVQAEKFKELQESVKRLKFSILKKRHEEKIKEIDSIVKAIGEKIEQKDKRDEKSRDLQTEIDSLSEKIMQINTHIRKATGTEQSKIREEITNFRAELEGLKVRKEGYENRLSEVQRRIEEMKKTVPEIESEIKKLREESPQVAQKAKEIKKKKDELAELEAERKRVLTLKTELNSIKERIEDKKRQIARANGESSSLIKQLEEISRNLKFQTEKEGLKSIEILKKELTETTEKLKELEKTELHNEKIISISESDIKRNNEVKNKVEKIDLCPLCQSKITDSHIKHVFQDADEKINLAREQLEKAKTALETIHKDKINLRRIANEAEIKLRSTERELSIHHSLKDKNDSIKRFVEYEDSLKKEISELENKRKNLELKSEDFTKIDEKYRNKMLEIEEVSSRTLEDIDTTLLYKERELERTKSIVETGKQDIKDIQENIEDLASSIEEKQSSLEEREKQERELNERFKKMFSDRDEAQKQIQERNIKFLEMRTEARQIEDQINYLKIGKAKIDGGAQTIEMDINEFSNLEIINGSMNYLDERLKKIETTLASIGSINMRALEVYDEVKKEYGLVKEKTDILEKEKTEIMKIIEEIDKKKKKTFMKTFHVINELFTRNFSKLSAKGTAYLEIENKEDVFAGGIDIVVKLAKGKYFDVSSLSGGEQTLVTLSLLFAIQEFKPYQFYILDEIDAALDKRNSERLAALLKQYMQSGQYIIVTHNDALILDAGVLYGVSMHESVSKVLSLKVSDDKSPHVNFQHKSENNQQESQ